MQSIANSVLKRIQKGSVIQLGPSLCLCALVVLIFAVGLGTPISGQRQTRRLPPSPRPRPAPVDYSKFSHSTKKHQAACDTCHKVPTQGWQKTSSFPDITDYPGHEACVSCHRSQFFKGDRPVICSGCHTKTSPRDEARLLFRNPKTNSQFLIEFPHDRHQDVIASFRGKPDRPRKLLAHASLSFSGSDEPSQTYNNCTICHGDKRMPAPPKSGWPDSFQPKPETFKDAPSGHDSCFNCHWKGQQPIAQNCSGCHKLSPTPGTTASTTRISLKFMHEGGGEKKVHVAECTTCHINITKSVTLRGLKPDVPITSCTECHNKEGLRQDVSKELVAIDKNRGFLCVYCHTSNVGSLDPPASHYLIAERPPLKRTDIK
jgi:hypothetical protein